MRVLQLKLKKFVHRIQFNADASILAICSHEATRLTAIELHTGRAPALPASQGERPTCFAYSGDGEYLAVGATDGFVRPYRLRGGPPLAVHRITSSAVWPSRGIQDVCFAPTSDPSNQWLAMCGREFWLWNPVTQQYLIAPEEEQYLATTFDAALNTATVLSLGAVRQFSLKPFREVWKAVVEVLPCHHPDGRWCIGETLLQMSADDSVVAVGTGMAIHLLNPDDGESRDVVESPVLVNDIAFLPNSRLLAVADGSPTLRVYDTDNGSLAREYDWGIGGIHCVTFSHDGAMGAAGGDKGRIVVWDLE